jgi:hypothetical protein
MKGSILKVTTFIEMSPRVTEGERCRCSQKGRLRHALDLPPLVSKEATRVYILIGNQEILLAAVYKFPTRTWNDADITKLLSFRHKCILAADLNAKHQSWNSTVIPFWSETIAIL